MKAASFEYHTPSTLAETVQLLSTLDGARLIAGGQSLVPALATRAVSVAHMVDVRKIEELRGIERRGSVVRIGAGTTQAAAERHPDVAAVPLLARAIPRVGHLHIRNRGTVGGSLAHADPGGEIPAVAVALDAQIEVLSTRGARTVVASDFFVGHHVTSLTADEVVVAVNFPVWDGRCGFALHEFARRYNLPSTAGAAVALELGADDRVRRCAITLFGVGPVPRRATAVESMLVGAVATSIDAADAGRRAFDGLTDVPSDLNGSAAYRTRVGAVMVARALTDAIEEACRA